jgi:hypothetical protein
VIHNGAHGTQWIAYHAFPFFARLLVEIESQTQLDQLATRTPRRPPRPPARAGKTRLVFFAKSVGEVGC